jgi:hypothetical protein
VPGAYKSSASRSGTSITLPTHDSGDIILISARRAGSITPPTLLRHRGGAAAFAAAMRHRLGAGAIAQERGPESLRLRPFMSSDSGDADGGSLEAVEGKRVQEVRDARGSLHQQLIPVRVRAGRRVEETLVRRHR